jgi:nucleic acid/nucleotide deaminase of polymorphic system toxin
MAKSTITASVLVAVGMFFNPFGLPFAPTKAPILPPFKPGGPTSGHLYTPKGNLPLKSGMKGPAKSIPKGSAGFNAYSKTHVEGHAVAWMKQNRIKNGIVYINNPVICDNCMNMLPRMLPCGSHLTVVTPDGVAVTFTGGSNVVTAIWPGGTVVTWHVLPLPK